MNAELSKIADYLLLKSPLIQDIGLFHGKMGLVVALFAYAHRYNDSLLEEYAWDLFQQVYDKIHVDMPIGLENGLIGIGYATTLLCKQKWADCDLNDILADIDAKIMERDPRRMTDFSIRSGVGGLQLYLTTRQQVDGALLTFNKQYLQEIQSMIANRHIPNSPQRIIDILCQPSFSIKDYIEQPIDIDGGSAYYILKETLA